MNPVPIISWTALKIALSCLAIGGIGPCLLWGGLTIPVGWMLRPLLVAAAVLGAGIAVGFALRMQGGDTDGR